MLRWFRDERAPLSEQIAALRQLAQQPDDDGYTRKTNPCPPPKPKTVQAWRQLYQQRRTA